MEREEGEVVDRVEKEYGRRRMGIGARDGRRLQRWWRRWRRRRRWGLALQGSVDPGSRALASLSLGRM